MFLTMSWEPDNATAAWDALARHLERFVDAWESVSDKPPQLGDYLPPAGDSLRHMALVELIKLDLEQRLQRGIDALELEQYAAEFPELAAEGRLPPDLIYEDFHIRHCAGQPVTVEQYAGRFPEQADEIRRLLALESPAVTTRLFRGERAGWELSAGESIDEFDLLVLLGQGAFARVFLARQRSMQRLVALKVSAQQGTEPQTLAQLDHPNIVRVFDQRTLPERGLRMLYMQFVAGGTLQAVIEAARQVPLDQRSGCLLVDVVRRHAEQASGGLVEATATPLADQPWPNVVCWIGAQLAMALEYAHGHGILHRDIKPANVLLSADGVPKLADFNISYSSKLEGVTPAAYFGGSLAYMSPEQLEACDPSHPRQPDELDERSDLYSLCVVLWELLFGQRPFDDPTPSGAWSAIVQGMLQARRAGPPPAPLQPRADGVLGRLVDTLRRCLAFDRRQRFAHGKDLARQLLLCLQSEAMQLCSPPAGRWRRVLSQWPITLILTAALVPNILAAVFNFFYNYREIILRLEHSQQAFWNIQAVINSVAFPVGAGLAAYLAWPLVRHLLARGRHPPADLVALRRRALSLGHYVALIGITEWLIAGIAYPISLHVLAGPIGPGVYVHFLASLALCGLIAAAYPFFLITLLALRLFWPALVREGELTGDDCQALERAARRAGVYLLVAGCVPALSMLLLAVTSMATQSHNPIALVVLSAVGAVGFGGAFWMYRTIQHDAAVLVEAVRRADPLSLVGESRHWLA